MTPNTETVPDAAAVDTRNATKISAAADYTEIVGNAGNQGDSAGKSVGNDREIPENRNLPNNAGASTALKKVDPLWAARDRLSEWASYTTLGDLNRDGEAFVVDLCEKHTYAQVVEILALPRPVGLNLKTSVSSVQRFYATYRAEAMEEEAQIAKDQIELILADSQDNNESFYRAARHLLKRRLLETSISPVGKSDEICRLFGMLERIRLTDLAERRLAFEEQKAGENP